MGSGPIEICAGVLKALTASGPKEIFSNKANTTLTVKTEEFARALQETRCSDAKVCDIERERGENDYQNLLIFWQPTDSVWCWHCDLRDNLTYPIANHDECRRIVKPS